MFRAVFGRAAATAAAAGAAGAAAATTSQAHAHARPLRIFPGGSLVDDRTGNGGSSLKIEDDWLVPQVQGEDILFSAEEIEKTVEEISGIATGGVKVYTASDSDNDTEIIDNEVNAVIDQANIVPAGEGMHQLAKMTTIMLSRPSIQREILQAFKEEDELRHMMDSLAARQGGDITLSFNADNRPALSAADPRIEDITDGDSKNFLQALMQDIARGLEAAGERVAQAGQRVGNFLGRMGRWLRGAGTAADQEDVSNGEKIVGLTLCFAAVVMAVLVAKRVGFIRVVSHR